MVQGRRGDDGEGDAPLSVSFCQYTVNEPDILVVPDLTAHPIFSRSPLVVGDPHVRFYAGAPLRVNEKDVIGTLCLLDTVPRPDFTAEDGDDLRALANVVAELVTGRAARMQIAEP